MPKAARARVASPSAGTALARAAWDCLPGRVRQRRGSKVYVTEIATDCNTTSLKERRNIFAADASAVTFHGLSFMRNRCRRHRSFLRKSASPAVIFRKPSQSKRAAFISGMTARRADGGIAGIGDIEA